jgi:L-ribulose-5-phosphate 4-epimerase
MPNSESPAIDLVSYVDEAKRDAIHAYNFLRDSGTLSASLTFNLTHRIPEHNKILSVRFPQPWVAAWSLAQKNFPILYVAAQRHLLAREIPNHLERTRSALDIVRERLDKHPELAPPPALLESNGGANFWGKGILKTAELVLLIEEAARFQAIAEQIGGAKQYTPGALDVQWKRTGLLEKARSFAGDYAPVSR